MNAGTWGYTIAMTHSGLNLWWIDCWFKDIPFWKRIRTHATNERFESIWNIDFLSIDKTRVPRFLYSIAGKSTNVNGLGLLNRFVCLKLNFSKVKKIMYALSFSIPLVEWNKLLLSFYDILSKNCTKIGCYYSITAWLRDFWRCQTTHISSIVPRRTNKTHS